MEKSSVPTCGSRQVQGKLSHIPSLALFFLNAHEIEELRFSFFIKVSVNFELQSCFPALYDSPHFSPGILSPYQRLKIRLYFFPLNLFKQLSCILKVTLPSVYIVILICVARLTHDHKGMVGRRGEIIEPCDNKSRNPKGSN